MMDCEQKLEVSEQYRRLYESAAIKLRKEFDMMREIALKMESHGTVKVDQEFEKRMRSLK